MFSSCSQKSAFYNHDLRKVLSAVSDNIAVPRGSAVHPSVRPSVLCACQHRRHCLDGVQNAEGGPRGQIRKQQRTAEVKELVLCSAYVSCSGNNAIVFTACREELT